MSEKVRLLQSRGIYKSGEGSVSVCVFNNLYSFPTGSWESFSRGPSPAHLGVVFPSSLRIPRHVTQQMRPRRLQSTPSWSAHPVSLDFTSITHQKGLLI